MTRAHHILRELATRNVAVTLEGARLRFSPRAALDPALIAQILACKTEILALVATAALVPPTPHPHPRLAIPHYTPPSSIHPHPAPALHLVTPLQRWLLHTLAEARSPLPPAVLHRRLDLATHILLSRGELQLDGAGALALRST
jgi:hypothetical protein